MALNIQFIRHYCSSKRAVQETFPFNEDVVVFKVFDKIFLLIDRNSPKVFNVKCDPEKAIALREQYIEVKPGYHMNKKHWNTVSIEGRLTDEQLLEMIDHSYDLVVRSFPKNKTEGQS